MDLAPPAGVRDVARPIIRGLQPRYTRSNRVGRTRTLRLAERHRLHVAIPKSGNGKRLRPAGTGPTEVQILVATLAVRVFSWPNSDAGTCLRSRKDVGSNPSESVAVRSRFRCDGVGVWSSPAGQLPHMEKIDGSSPSAPTWRAKVTEFGLTSRAADSVFGGSNPPLCFAVANGRMVQLG